MFDFLISQLYFDGDPLCGTDPWCQEAGDRILVLQENNLELYGQMDFSIDSTINGIILGDVNFDGNINVQDILILVGIIVDNIQANDFQMYAADVNGDSVIDILDIISIVNIILGTNRRYHPLEKGEIKIEKDLVNIYSVKFTVETIDHINGKKYNDLYEKILVR